MARYILRYTGNGFLHIKDLDITFRRGDSFELVGRTGLDINRLRSHRQIEPYLGNLLIEELVEHDPPQQPVTIIKDNSNFELNQKMDLLLKSLTPEVLGDLVKNALKDKVVFKESSSKNLETDDNEDDEIRKNLLKDLVFRDNDKGKANLEGYGKSEKKIDTNEADGLDDLIDF